MTFETNSRVNITELQLSAGQTQIFTDFRSYTPCAIAVHPSPGATVFVSLSLSTTARLKAGTALFVQAGIGDAGLAPDGVPAGIVTVADGLEMLAPASAVRFVCVGGTAIVELVQ